MRSQQSKILLTLGVQRAEETGFPLPHWWEWKMVNLLESNLAQLAQRSVLSELFSQHHDQTNSQCVCTTRFVEARKCPPKKVKTLVPFAVTWMNLEIIILSELSQTKVNIIWYHSFVESDFFNDLNELIYKTETDRFQKKIMITKGETLQGWIN